MKRYLFPGLCILALVFALHTMTLASGVPSELPVEPVEIVTAEGGRHSFHAHVADTDETRSRGLMYVTALEADHAMLFDFGTPRHVGMWMKNTPLSLDMLFIDQGGRITRIVARTRPFSTRTIESGAVVRGVLEIRGGLAEELGIAPGDQVLHRVFDLGSETK